jgi:peroxiredoxin
MSFPKSVIVTLAALALAITTTHAAELKVGDTFPDLRQFGLAGELPGELKGKIVLVDFWASWCAPCKLSFPVLNDLSARFGARGLVVVGVSVDESKAAMQEFLKQTAPRFSVVHDARQKLVQSVDVASMPTSFIIDGSGKVRFIHSGFHGDKTRDEYAREIESLLPTRAAK